MIVDYHKDGWILDKMGRELSGIKEFPDLTYFINYSRYTPVESRTAALFTHLEPFILPPA